MEQPLKVPEGKVQGGWSETSSSGTWGEDKRQWTQTGTQEELESSGYQEAFLDCAGYGAQVAQRDGGISSLDIVKSHLDSVLCNLF